jgi:hypothetical protein
MVANEMEIMYKKKAPINELATLGAGIDEIKGNMLRKVTQPPKVLRKVTFSPPSARCYSSLTANQRPLLTQNKRLTKSRLRCPLAPWPMNLMSGQQEVGFPKGRGTDEYLNLVTARP